MRTTKEDLEDWFKEGGCPELSNCRRNGMNLAIAAKGTTLDKTELLLDVIDHQFCLLWSTDLSAIN